MSSPLPEGIQDCRCYQAKPDDVEAWHSSYGSNHVSVKIHTRGGEWVKIWRHEGDRTAMSFVHKSIDWKMAGIILWSYCGNQKLVGHTALAKKLRDWKAHDLRRLTPQEIRRFLIENQKPMP